MNNKNQPEYKGYIGHRKRVREKFLQSKTGEFADYELLEILLFSANPRLDVKPLAKRLIEEFGNIRNIINAETETLKAIKGVSDGVLVAIKIVREIIVRSLKQEIGKKIIIESWKALIDYCQVSLSYLNYEQTRILFLNKNYQLIADELHCEGSIESVVIDAVAIVKRALLLAADSLILIHNHPTGNIEPSRADIDNTNKIINALKAVNIKVYDHLIVGRNNYFSFKNSGLI